MFLYRVFEYAAALKREARKILTEWSNDSYLKSKSKGEIIYVTGRNFTVHGASGTQG